MLDIFQLGFMVRALIVGGLVGVVCPILGTFLVLRRFSLIADTLAHVALAGAAIGLLLHQSPLLVALPVSAAASLLLEWLRSSQRLSGDASLALVLYSALAVAVIVLSLSVGLSAGVLGYLFGNIVTATSVDVWAIAVLSLAALFLVGLLYTELVQATFDPVLARVSGVPVGRVNLVLALLTGVTVTLSMRVVGALLVGALIVFPTLAALQAGRGFRLTLVVGAFLGALSVLVGLTLSYYQDLAPGGAIVITAVAILAAATLARRAVLEVRARTAAASRSRPSAPSAGGGVLSRGS